jgi:hypothetical protein
MDAWWFDESRARQQAVQGLLAHVHAAQLLGTRPVRGTYPSDHCAVQAEIRY